MNKRLDLTEGSIASKLVKLALPIMGTSFIQMAYNMIDMMWVGRDGSDSVAAVGTAGFYTWLAMSFIMISKIGGEIKVAQSIGEHNIKATKGYIKSSIELNMIFSVTYMLVLLIFNKPLIELFRLGDTNVTLMGRHYLIVVSIGMVCYFINPVFTSIFNGLGNSKTPFKINTVGLVANIILDPILIFGFGPIPHLGVVGAALATVLAQVIVTLCFISIIIRSKEECFKVKLFRNINADYYKILCHIGLPVALQEGLFTIFSMVMGVIVAGFGSVAIAAQKVGTQIESISWNSSEGLSAALSTFVGQNYGAKKYSRINRGSRIAILTAIVWGIFTSCALIFFSKPLFSIFVNEIEAIEKGSEYLRVLGYSQLFMCIEITITGIFKGIGRTKIPSYIGIIFTGARIPMALLLSKENILGLSGIWWSISISSVFKGTILLSVFLVLRKLKKLYKEEVVQSI
ncbi:MAG: MATE family efflux transporter [Clostridium sp.]|nr:MATE family efflux transporter [Clostridium sp.]